MAALAVQFSVLFGVLAVQFLILFSFVSFVSFVSLLLILAPWRLTTFRFLYPDKAVIAEARI